MRFSEVHFHDIRRCAQTGRIAATVVLVNARAAIQCSASADISADIGPDVNEAEIRALLFDDALRQMRQMPEFRNEDQAGADTTDTRAA